MAGIFKKICVAALTAVLPLSALTGDMEVSAAQTVPTTLSIEPAADALTEASAEQELTDEELRAYFGDSVFIGDSIMLGFRNYSAKQDTYVHDIQFLAVGSYGVQNALKPVNENNIHPRIEGIAAERECRSRADISQFFLSFHPLIEIENAAADSQDELMLIKDSYANSMVPFLAHHYKQIYILDTRYYRDGPSSFLSEHETITDILLLYNLNTLDSDTGIRGIY